MSVKKEISYLTVWTKVNRYVSTVHKKNVYREFIQYMCGHFITFHEFPNKDNFIYT